MFYCNKSKTSISHDHISKILGSPYCFFDIIISHQSLQGSTQSCDNNWLIIFWGGGDVIIPAASSMNVPDLILMIVWIYLIRGAETNKLPLLIQKPDVPVLYIFWYCEILNLVSKYYTILYNILQGSKYITQVLIHWLMTPTVQCTNSEHSVNNDCMPQWEQLLTTYLPPSPFPIFPKLCNILNTAPSTHKSPYPSIVSKINVMRSRAIHILIFSW